MRGERGMRGGRGGQQTSMAVDMSMDGGDAPAPATRGRGRSERGERGGRGGRGGGRGTERGGRGGDRGGRGGGVAGTGLGRQTQQQREAPLSPRMTRGDDSTINAVWVKTPTMEQNTRAFLYPHFQRFGQIVSVSVERNFAIVKFGTYQEAEAALRGGATLPNSTERLRLQWAKPRRDSTDGNDASPGQGETQQRVQRVR